jgi:hypothetical protein
MMAERIKQKIGLNYVTHSVRASQAVLQYGVGSMVDFPDQTLITAAPEFWSESARIYDDRFAKALSVDYFAVPTKTAYSRFPEWYFCPKCRTFQPIVKWVADYKRKAKGKKLEFDEHMTKYIQCLDCGQDLVVARIITVCEQGHINDFPWIKWVHRQSKKPICGNPVLKFKTGASGTEGLEGLSITCSCGAFTTLKGAFEIKNGVTIFERLDKEFDSDDFRCEGGHPHKNQKERCLCYPRTVQRGSSSVYFPVVYSSLVIPPYADKLNGKIEKSNAFAACISIIEDEEPEDRIDMISKRISKWADKIAVEIGASSNNVQRILIRKWLEPDNTEVDVTSVKYRSEEYEALNGEVSVPEGVLGDFSREGLPGSEYDIPHIKSISLIDKVRVVNALIGFSRINPVSGKNDYGFVHVKESGTRWYPAYEVRGEGIFIEFNQIDIETWVLNNPQVVEQAKRINNSYSASFTGKNHPRVITPKFILLHTISHLLIKQLSFECGYSIASLNERIYCAEESDGKQMEGIFIYTASGDSEGTLGGLVRQGRPDVLPRIFKKAIANAQTCSNDPVCILSRGQGRESLNLAACYACALLPETCCEERNAFLDRGILVGTYESKTMGFYNGLS